MLSGRVGRFLVNSGIVGWLSNIFVYSGRSLQDVLEELTDNVELRAVMAYNFGDHGNSDRNIS